MDEITISVLLNTLPNKVYAAWMDEDLHAAFTGAEASIENHVGGVFEAWDGYISGTTLVLEPNRRIVQSWRTSEFKENAEPSLIEVLLTEQEGKTLLTINHKNIPKGDGRKYKKGWKEFYIEPLKVYFS